MGFTRVCGWLALSSLLAAGAQTTATSTQASVASATFTYMSDDGCVQNDVAVFANRTTVVSAKAPATTEQVTYFRYRHDDCADSDLGTDQGTSLQPLFSGDLNRASLNATINGYTASGSAITVSFVLFWQGKGRIARQAGQPQNTRAGGAGSMRNENLIRSAVVSGTMDGRDISAATVGASLRTTRKTISR
jgi:hypothetical protein